MLILTALLLAEARLQHTLQDIRALWKCSIATILRKSIDCQSSAGFNVNCSERNQPSLQNTLLCPVHYHSFKKFSSNVSQLYLLSICHNLLYNYVLPTFYIFKLLQLVLHFLHFLLSDNKCILNRLTFKGPLLLVSLNKDSVNEVDEHSVEAFWPEIKFYAFVTRVLIKNV